jgi:Putative transmembrane protein (PGPGW)
MVGMTLRRLALKVGVTIAGPLVILAGVAMLVLPGPGLVVIAAGFGLLAAEYPWARRLVVAGGHLLGRLRQLAFPTGGSPTRKLTGLLATGAAIVGSTLATGAITAYVGSVVVL